MARERKRSYPPGVRPLAGRPGWWRVRVWAVDPKTGQRKEVQRHFQGSEAEAVLFRAREQAAAEAGGETRERQTLDGFATSWIEAQKLRGTRKTTLHAYAIRLDLHILPTFGAYYIDQINARDVEAWLQESARTVKPRRDGTPSGQTYSPTAINAWLLTLQTMLRDWARQEDVPLPAAALVRKLKRPPRPLDAPANTLGTAEHRDDLRRILAYWRDHHFFWFAYYFLGSTTGMRPGELAGLDRGDLHPEGGYIDMVRSWGGRRYGMQLPKNGKPRRLPYGPVQQSVIEEHLRRIDASGYLDALAESGAAEMAPDAVFPSPRFGRRISTPTARKAIEVAAKRCGLPPLTPKSMRRTFNDLMRVAGVEGTVLRSIVGHASSALTDVYSTVTTGEKVAAVARIVPIVALQPDTKPDTGPDGSRKHRR